MSNVTKTLDRALKALDKALKMLDESIETKEGELGGLKYRIVKNANGRYDFTLNGKPWKRNVQFASINEAEKNARMGIGEVLSWERQTGKKAKIRGAM